MIAAVAALFAACAEKDTFKEAVQEDVAIGFNATLVSKVTKAEITTAYLREVDASNQIYHDFGVFGYKASQSNFTLFDNEQLTVVRTGAGSDQSPYVYDWTHTTVRFWDKSSTATYTFYAYAPYNAYNATGSEAGISFTKIPVITKIQANHIDDVVVATPYIAQTKEQCTSHTGITDHATTHSTYVPFVFNHIFSRLSFKVKTHEDYSATATFTVKSIELNFPSDKSSNEDQVSWSGNGTTNTITYSTNYAATSAPTPSTTYETTVYSNTTGQVATVTPAPIGDAFIVTPVNTAQPKHAFNIKLTYDVEYWNTDNSSAGKETDCIATGRIDTKVVENVESPAYNPAANESWVITIDINPDQIDFCADKVNGWDSPDEYTGEVK